MLWLEWNMTELMDITAAFERNVESVYRLVEFDKIILDVAVQALRQVASELEEKHNLHNAASLISNRAKLLANIKTADSLRPNYESMFNQCVVLLVSYFGSSLHDLLRHGIVAALRKGIDLPAARLELKVSWRVLDLAEGEIEARIADLLISQNDISFQDMQSIGRAFSQNLGVSMERTQDSNNVILGQAARHVIVHAAAKVNKKMLRQLEGANPRSIKKHLSEGSSIHFSPDEIRLLGESMLAYIRETSNRVSTSVGE